LFAGEFNKVVQAAIFALNYLKVIADVFNFGKSTLFLKAFDLKAIMKKVFIRFFPSSFHKRILIWRTYPFLL